MMIGKAGVYDPGHTFTNFVKYLFDSMDQANGQCQPGGANAESSEHIAGIVNAETNSA